MIWTWVIAVLLLVDGNFASAFSWMREPRTKSTIKVQSQMQPSVSPSDLLQTGPQIPSAYEIALTELKALDSEPLCHQTAARLLVNNCQLLQGKDEATVLTDSGRQVRDFVDAYAASLAICDLERGSFLIPKECTKFREPVLNQLALQSNAQLHVTTSEIDGCLSGLATSDSAWNTWVSYRHKALRFCEAARADNEKSEHILLFRRLTKIMNTVMNDIDDKIAHQTADFDRRAGMAASQIDFLSPKLDRLRDGIDNAEDFISQHLADALKRSTDTVNSGIESAVGLQRMLEVMMATVPAANAEAASAHEQSLQVVSQKAETELNTVMTAMTAAMTSALNLQNEIELSRLQASEIEQRQGNLEQGMQRLIDITEHLSSKYDDHTQLLHQAQNLTNDILDSLEDTAASVNIIGDTFSARSSAASWWPYVWCPAASLVLGSYGLPPSALRNLGLVALGEGLGFFLSKIRTASLDTTYWPFLDFHSHSRSRPHLEGLLNVTAIPDVSGGTNATY